MVANKHSPFVPSSFRHYIVMYAMVAMKDSSDTMVRLFLGCRFVAMSLFKSYVLACNAQIKNKLADSDNSDIATMQKTKAQAI